MVEMGSRSWELRNNRQNENEELPTPRSLHSSALIYSQNSSFLVVFGGTTDFDFSTNFFHSLRDLWVYDSDKDTWLNIDHTNKTKNPQWPTPRNSHRVTMCHPESTTMYMFGGQAVDCPREKTSCEIKSSTITDELWKLDLSDISSPIWTLIKPMTPKTPSGRVFTGFVCLQNTLYVTGGVALIENAINASAIAIVDEGFIWTFPFELGEWMEAPVSVEAPLNNVTDIFSFHSVVTASSNTTFVVVGGQFNPFTFRQYVTVFDVTTTSWSAFPQSRAQFELNSRSYASGGTVDDTVIIFGGLTLIDLDDSVHQLLPHSRVMYEVPQNVFPSGRIYSSVNYLPERESLYVYGGYDGRIPRADFWQYDIQHQIWREILGEHAPGPRIAPLSITLNGNLYLGLGSGSHDIEEDLFVLNQDTFSFELAEIVVVDEDGNDITDSTNLRIMFVSETTCINIDGSSPQHHTHCFYFGPMSIIGFTNGFLAKVVLYEDLWVITERQYGLIEIRVIRKKEKMPWPSVRTLSSLTAFQTSSGRFGLLLMGGYGSPAIPSGEPLNILDYSESLALKKDAWTYWLDTSSFHRIPANNTPSSRYGAQTVVDGSFIYMTGGGEGISGVDVIAIQSHSIFNEVIRIKIDKLEDDDVYSGDNGAYTKWWMKLPSSDLGQRAHHSLLVFNETLVMWGGATPDGIASTAFVYNVLGCLPGHNATSEKVRDCQPCPKGTYAANSGATTCFACPQHLTTPTTGAMTLLECQQCVERFCAAGVCVVSNFFEPSCVCPFGRGGPRCRINYLQQAVISVLVCVLIIVVLVIAYRKFKKRLARIESYNLLQEQLLEETKGELMELEQASSIQPDEIEYIRRIDLDSPGGFGQVWLAKFSDVKVAVKQLKHNIDDVSEDEKQEFEEEIKFMRKLRHKNIVYFYGAGLYLNKPFLVTEYMSRGSLDVILRKSNKYPTLSAEQRIGFVRDTANGMAFLHNLSPPRIHRDLKSPNLLVNESWVVKVSDFGTSRLVEQLHPSTHPSVSAAHVEESSLLDNTSRTMTKHVGTLLWSAPEVHQGDLYSLSADVYSFGIVMWEIYTRQLPFEHLNSPWAVREAVINGERPSIPKDLCTNIKSLMERCWAEDATQRPSFNDIVAELKQQEQGGRQKEESEGKEVKTNTDSNTDTT
eukprot:m.72841 g.72841  ORF g.72841 m.72841 type:complete len:1162 (-) comp11758_c2_seq4:142-3627(-)